MLILYVPSTVSATGHIFLYWFGVAYKLQLASYSLKTVSKYAARSCSAISGALAQNAFVASDNRLQFDIVFGCE